MVPVYICDDDARILAFLKRELEDAILIEGHDMYLAAAATDPTALLQAVQAGGGRGVYFLDVDLKHPEYNGFQLAAKLRELDPRGFIIFVTTHGELALETFRYKLEAMDYIVKDQMDALPARLRGCLASVRDRLFQEKRDASELYTVKVFDEVHHIPVRQILYFETSAQKHRLVLHTDDALLEFFDNLQGIQDRVGEGFWRCHRSYLVNRDRVRRVGGKENLVELDNGETIPLSRKAKKEAQSV